MVACAATLAANAATVTYTQIGEQPASNISMDGLPSSTEITATPQLAFPGVTVNDIHGYTFLSELYGGTGEGYENTVLTRTKAWGINPHKHYANGIVDVMYMQFSMYETDSGANYAKHVILVFTNGDGGVYVHKFGTCYYAKGGNEWAVGVDCCQGRNSAGYPTSFTTGGDGPKGSSTDNGGTYKAWGIRIHGMRPVPQARLAFPGLTIAEVKNLSFIAGHHGAGDVIDYTTLDEPAEDVKYLPSFENATKIVMQFRERRQSNRACIVMLTDGAGGVHATQTHHRNNAGTTFTLVEDSGAACGYTVSGFNVSTFNQNDVREGATYCVDEFYALPKYAFLPSGSSSVESAFETRFPLDLSNPFAATPIGSTRTLAFPGVTLDDVASCKFLALRSRGAVDGCAVDFKHTAFHIGEYATPVDTNGDGHYDKIVMQFSGIERSDNRCAIIELTNGDDGVYVQKISHRISWGNCDLGSRAFEVASDGTVTYTGNYPSNTGTSGYAYSVRGFVALSPEFMSSGNPVSLLQIMTPDPSTTLPIVNRKVLAFVGATLDDLVNCTFTTWRGRGTVPNYEEYACSLDPQHAMYYGAKYITSVDTDSDGHCDKIVFQFDGPTSGDNRAAVYELTNGDGGVYVKKIRTLYTTTGANFSKAAFSVAADGTVNYNGWSGTTGYDNDFNYAARGLVAVAKKAGVNVNPVLVWTKKNGVLTLNDLAGAKFTAVLTGDSGAVEGLNTRETIDANGDITSVTTEFQNSNRKTVVVKFTNGADGVYAQALGAVDVTTFGYVASDVNGNLYGSAYVPVAGSDLMFGYGAHSLTATANAAKLYRQGTTYTFGFIDDASPAASTMVPRNAATPLLAGMTLEELSGRTFMTYLGTGAVDNPKHLLGKFTTLYTADDDKQKVLTQFTNADGSWKKSAFVQFAAADNGVLTLQKVRRKHSLDGNANTQFFVINGDGTVDYSILPGSGGNGTNDGYDIHGFKVYPGFVQTTAALVFKGATLNDLETATFSARFGGSEVNTISADRTDGYNTKVVKDGSGDVTSILTEFQYLDGSSLKAVVVEFTNGAGGVYAAAKTGCTASGALGFVFVTDYDGATATYAGTTVDVSANAWTPSYGVFDVQAEVIAATEWVLDQNRSWSEFTGGEPIDDAAAIIRIKVTGDSPVLTIDENATVGQIVFVNETGATASTNTVVIGGGAVASIGSIKLGAGAQVSLPPSLASAEAALGANAKLVYAGPATVAQVVSGAGSVEVASGNVTFMAANTFAGGLVVKSGATAVAGFAPGRGSAGGPFGAVDGAVTVEAGGMVDINGKNGLSYRYTLAGAGIGDKGPIVNQGGVLDIGSMNWNREWTTGHARKFTLASDVTLGAVGDDFGVVASSRYELPEYECWLDLGDLGNETGYTLTETGTGTLWLWASQLSASGYGTLSIQQGTVDIRKGRYVGASSAVAIGTDGTLRLGSQMEVASITNGGLIQIVPWYYNHSYSGATLTGAYSGSGKVEVLSGGRLNVGAGLSVADFENKGTVEGSGALTVTGTLTPGAAIPNLTLASGATIELLATNAAPQVVTGAFSASGTVTVDVSAVEKDDLVACAKAGDITLLTAPSIPSGVTWAVSDPSKLRARVRRDGEGDHLVITYANGFTIFIR